MVCDVQRDLHLLSRRSPDDVLARVGLPRVRELPTRSAIGQFDGRCRYYNSTIAPVSHPKGTPQDVRRP